MFASIIKFKKMKFKILSLLILCSWLSNAQTTKFSIEASYPLPVDKNFVGNQFKGIADLGIKYRIKNLQVINIGISLNGSMLTYSDIGYISEYNEIRSFKTTLYTVQPRAYAELNLKKFIKLHPLVGIGYSFLFANTDSKSTVLEQVNTFSINPETNKSGININVGLTYDIFTKVYLFTSFDYIALTNLKPGVPSDTYNTKINLLKLGIGIRL